jgi:hypothetical protein
MSVQSKQFMEFSTDLISWKALYKYIGKLEGVKKTGFLTDYIATEVWMNFTFRGYNFHINNQMQEYWFFVENADCPDEILDEIVSYCSPLWRK